MSDYHLTMLIISIIIFIGVAVIVGKILFDHYCDYKVYNRHIQNLCWPYRVVQLGGGKYGLQHYYVRNVPGNTDPDYSMLDVEWTLVKKFDYRADAMVAMDEAMAAVIAERARVAYKEYKDAIKGLLEDENYTVCSSAVGRPTESLDKDTQAYLSIFWPEDLVNNYD